MKYFAYMSSFFPKSNVDELGEVLGRVKILHQMINLYVVEAPNITISSAVKEHAPVLLYNLLKLKVEGEVSEKGYLDDVYNTLLKLGRPKGAVKLECFDWNSRHGYSAKDIEVAMGNRLEEAGWKVQMEKPATLVYMVIADMHCYVGSIKYDKMLFLNPLRHYQKLASGISRAELKLVEAFDLFRIKARDGVALDLGAAPGGWSVHLAKLGFKVVAIDNGALNYEKISSLGITVKAISDTKQVGGFVGRYEILHVKSGFQKVSTTIKNVDLIASDMNVDAKEAIGAVLQFSDCLKAGADVIITIKCITRNFPKFVKQARTLLPDNFEIIGLRVLPSNRQEMTLYARKNG